MSVVKILSIRLAECSEIWVGQFMIGMTPFFKNVIVKVFCFSIFVVF